MNAEQPYKSCFSDYNLLQLHTLSHIFEANCLVMSNNIGKKKIVHVEYISTIVC